MASWASGTKEDAAYQESDMTFPVNVNSHSYILPTERKGTSKEGDATPCTIMIENDDRLQWPDRSVGKLMLFECGLKAEPGVAFGREDDHGKREKYRIVKISGVDTPKD